MSEERSDLLLGLIRRRWARQVLSALAAGGPLRYTDLLQKLSALDEGAVHNKSLSAALPYLHEHGLIRYVNKPPRDRFYAITDFGTGLTTHLEQVERYLAEHHPDSQVQHHRRTAHHVP
jgi:DNA-binding HxlR family transcriptional regulator